MSQGKHRPMRAPWWARICVVFGALLIVLSGGTLVAGTVVINQVADQVDTDDLLGEANADRQDIDGAINMLLVGTDYRDTLPDEPLRSDTMIMVHVPPTHDRAYLISVPRDLQVEIPPFPDNDFLGGTDKVNASFAYGGDVKGGFQLLTKTLENLSGLTFNTGAVINFYGFTDIVAVLGGVEMNVEVPPGSDTLVSIHEPYREFEPGPQLLDEHEALDYIRQRKQFPNGDYDRQRHQQQFVKAVMGQAISKGFDDPSKLGDLVKAAGDSLLLDQSVPIADLAFTLRNLRPENLTALRLPTWTEDAGGQYAEHLDEERASELFDAFETETVDQWMVRNTEYVNSI